LNKNGVKHSCCLRAMFLEALQINLDDAGGKTLWPILQKIA